MNQNSRVCVCNNHTTSRWQYFIAVFCIPWLLYSFCLLSEMFLKHGNWYRYRTERIYKHMRLTLIIDSPNNGGQEVPWPAVWKLEDSKAIATIRSMADQRKEDCWLFPNLLALLSLVSVDWMMATNTEKTRLHLLNSVFWTHPHRYTLTWLTS